MKGAPDGFAYVPLHTTLTTRSMSVNGNRVLSYAATTQRSAILPFRYIYADTYNNSQGHKKCYT